MSKNTAFAFALFCLIALCLFVFQPAKSQFLGSVYINPDGSVTGTSKIQRNENIYTLTANVSGGIQVQKGNIVIDGAGFAIIGKEMDKPLIDLTYGVGNPSTPQIYNVTIRNLMVVNGSIQTNGGGNNTFYNNYIDVISLRGSTYNNITHCIIGNIEMSYGASFNTITENNIMNGVSAFLVSNVTVDKNYWRFYLTKYPNATEVDNTGIGNQPYVYWTVETSPPLIYQDNHPLMKPVAIPELPDGTDNNGTDNDGAGETEPFPTLLIVGVTVTVVAVIAVSLLVYLKKRKR